MEILIWSDFVCPFCYIAEAHLKEALEQVGITDKVTIEYKSFLLNPTAEYNSEQTYIESFAQDKGFPIETAKQSMQQVADMAAQSGVEINYNSAKYAGTYDAHRVFQYAKSEGKGNEFFERLYRAHFVDGLVLSDYNTIAALATEVGLDEERARDILNNNKYDVEVKQDFQQAQALEVQGVPFFVFDRKYAMNGAQPVEMFVQGLERAWGEYEGK